MTRGACEPTTVEPTTPPPRAWPDKLAQPARRALANAGFTRLEQLSAVSEAELAHLHGIGPNALAHSVRRSPGIACRSLLHRESTTEEGKMANVLLGMTMSLDGFINDRHGSVARLYPDSRGAAGNRGAPAANRRDRRGRHGPARLRHGRGRSYGLRIPRRPSSWSPIRFSNRPQGPERPAAGVLRHRRRRERHRPGEGRRRGAGSRGHRRGEYRPAMLERRAGG